jgi:4-amino-4-deoxy-L-arabinose transferase-like glycosyltransferase
MNRTCRRWLLPVVLLQAGFFCFVSQHRLIDGDEGFYLVASRLVLQHKAPYLDFLYMQAPLLPYVYAAWFKLAGISWFSARLFSALLTALLGGLIYDRVCRETGKWLAGFAAVILFASASLIFAWYPIVKTFALASLFLFLTYLIVLRPAASTPGWLMALAGVCFGVSVDVRSYVAAVIPVFLAWVLWRHRARRTASLWFLGGFVLGITPSLALFFASPDAFLFNNVGYHALRSEHGLIGDWRNKVSIVWLMFAGTHTGGQFSILAASCAAGVILSRRRLRDASLLSLAVALALAVISLLPTPSSLQYFSMIIPFLIVATVCSLSDYVSALPSPRDFRLASAVCGLLLAGFIGFGLLSFGEYLYSGREVPGIKGEIDAHNWTLQQVSAVSLAIDQLAVPGEKVVSFWPGFVFASWADPYPGFENNFGVWIAPDLTPSQRRKYRILAAGEMEAACAAHGPHIAVVGNQGIFSGGAEYAASAHMLQRHGYILARMVGETSIYECCAGR